jgi:cytochrome c-type biogenesis protein CcmE
VLKVKRSRIIAGLGIIGAVSIITVILIFNFRPYLQISQVFEDPSRYHNQEIQVIGIVEGYSGGNFNLTQGNNKIFIDVSDITVPDDVENGIQVAVMGWFNQLLYLNATQILVQCS